MTGKSIRFLAAAALAGMALLGSARTASAVTIHITYTDSPGEGFNDPVVGAQRRTAIEAAAANWANRLQGAVPIEIEASMDPMEGDVDWAVLGGAYANDFELYSATGFTKAPLRNVYYPVALANNIQGKDLDPGYPDIIITYNSEVDNPTILGASKFYYGTDGAVSLSPGGDGYSYYNIDFYQTCLHEIGHGLGFSSLLQSSGLFYGGYPSAYDYYIATDATAAGTRLRTLGQAVRAQKMVQGTLFFAGTNARLAAGGASPKIYAPSPYEQGSSVSHLDEDTYSSPWAAGPMPAAQLNELMTPYLGPGNMHHNGPLVAGVLMDIGWKFKPYTTTEIANAFQGAAGLRASREAEVVRLQRNGLTTYPGRLTIADVMAAARAAAGTDPNPFLMGSP